MLRERHVLTVFGNRVLRNMLRPKRDKIVGGWRMKSFITSALRQIQLQRLSEGE
jgi:hypothetical protein